MLKLVMSWVASLPQVLGILHWGANDYWFGLGCPAHCNGSLGHSLAILVAGFGLGALTVLVFFRQALFLLSALPVPADHLAPRSPRGVVVPRPASLRLRGYLCSGKASHSR